MDFIQNVSSRLITKILIFVIGIPSGIIIARYLGPEGKGILALVSLILPFLVLFGDLGIRIANTYFTANKKFEVDRIISNSLLLGFLNGITSVLIFLFLYKVFLQSLFFKDIEPIFVYLTVIAIPFSITSEYFGGILFGKLKIMWLNLVLIFTNITNLIGTAVIIMIFHGNVFHLIILTLFMSLITFAIYLILMKNIGRFVFKLHFKVLKESLNFGLKGYLANLISFFSLRINMFLINSFVGITQVGFYSLSTNIAEMVWYFPDSIQTILFPEVSSKDSKSSDEMTAKVLRNVIFISILLCLFILVGGKLIIRILYGNVFLSSYTPLIFLLPGIVMVSVSKILSAYLFGRGKPEFALYASSVSLIVNILMNLLLIPKWGIIGAAISFTISYFFEGLVFIINFLRISSIGFFDNFIIHKSDFMLYFEILRRITKIRLK